MLTAVQIEKFKEDGVLILPDFFNEYEIITWKNEVKDFYGKPSGYLEWQQALNTISSKSLALCNVPSPNNHPKLKNLFSCFKDISVWGGENELVPRSPDIDAEWLGASTPHLDYPIFPQSQLILNTIFYLDEVSSYSAPFMYWKGSHHKTWEYFKQKPTEYAMPRYLDQEQTFKSLTNMMEKDPVAFYAKAGDLLLWHPLLLHSPSVNISYHPRLAFVGRWGAALKAENLNFERDKWSYYNFNETEKSMNLNLVNNI